MFVESHLPPPKYVLFGWDSRHPMGGINDKIEQFNNLITAIEFTKDYMSRVDPVYMSWENYHLMEMSTGKYVDWNICEYGHDESEYSEDCRECRKKNGYCSEESDDD